MIFGAVPMILHMPSWHGMEIQQRILSFDLFINASANFTSATIWSVLDKQTTKQRCYGLACLNSIKLLQRHVAEKI